MMRVKAITLLIVAACFLAFAAPAYSQHWTPPGWWPGPYGQTVWGQLAGFTGLDSSDQVAAFRVSDDALVGLSYITVSGGFWYNMVIHALTTASVEVYFLVWDGTSELNAYTNFTASPDSPPPSTQHDLQDQAVPEQPSIIMFVVSLGLLYFFMKRPRPSAISLRRSHASPIPLGHRRRSPEWWRPDHHHNRSGRY